MRDEPDFYLARLPAIQLEGCIHRRISARVLSGEPYEVRGSELNADKVTAIGKVWELPFARKVAYLRSPMIEAVVSKSD